MNSVSRYFFLISLVSISMLTTAQELDTLSIDSLEIEVKKSYVPDSIGVFVEAGTELSDDPDGQELSYYIGLGLQYKKYSIGFFVSDYQGSLERRLIFPNDFELDYQHGGIWLGRDIIDRKLWTAGVRVYSSWGDILWRASSNGEDRFRDVIGVVQPAVHIEFKPIRYTRIFANIGYRLVYGLDLTGLEGNELDSVTIRGGVKIGFFKFKKPKLDESP